MVITTTASRAFEKVFLDVVGPLPKSQRELIYFNVAR